MTEPLVSVLTCYHPSRPVAFRGLCFYRQPYVINRLTGRTKK